MSFIDESVTNTKLYCKNMFYVAEEIKFAN